MRRWRRMFYGNARKTMSYDALYTPFLVATGATQLTIRGFTRIKLVNFTSGSSSTYSWKTDTNINVVSALDQGSSLQAGKDYYVYLCIGGVIKVSLNSTYPNGYDADTSRKIGGFHTLCVNVGTISGHTLSGLTAGSILPNSVWCLNFRPTCSPEGMVYCAAIDGCWKQPPPGTPQMPLWVDIYLQSGTGASTASVYGGTVTDSRSWDRHVDDLAAVGKRMLFDHEFTIAAYGSNAKTNIQGGSDPVTTGGHVDTAGRRMISHWGVEDACGAMWQWLLDSNYYHERSNFIFMMPSQIATVYHTTTPGGNRVYLKYNTDGQPYLCCNLATLGTDTWVTFGSYKVMIKHDTGASSGLPVYINRAASYGRDRILVNNTITNKDALCQSTFPEYYLKVTHNTGASSYPALYFDDGADMRFEANMDGSDTNVDLCYVGLNVGWSDLGDNLGLFNKQSTIGQATKYVAGGNWLSSTNCGPRCRQGHLARWASTYYDTTTRGCCEPKKN